MAHCKIIHFSMFFQYSLVIEVLNILFLFPTLDAGPKLTLLGQWIRKHEAATTVCKKLQFKLISHFPKQE
jgi:hypothetical protein